ncbi:hypothetical protein HDU81_006453 [Chytriomyces hyalinus]|nr:hypothetical protein HDU81_006453 [Chytriomyces hyalinus]
MHPTCNKLLAVRWESYVFEIHRRNLQKARHTIDDSKPKVYKHLDMRLKKTQTEEERMHTIEKNNNILFNRIMSQKLRDTDVSSIRDSRAFDKRRDHIHEAHTHIRQCRNDNILKDNLTILQRIEEKAPNYNRLAWYSDRLRNLGYLCNIAEYPKHYLDQLEEGKPHYDLVRPKTHEITHTQKGTFNPRKSQTAPDIDTRSSTLLRPKTRGQPTSSPLLGESQPPSAAASVIAGAENNDTDSVPLPVETQAIETPAQDAPEPPPPPPAANAEPTHQSPKQTPGSKSTSIRGTPKQISHTTISRQDCITKASTPKKSSVAGSPRKQTSQIQVHDAPTTPTQKSITNFSTATPTTSTPKKQLSSAALLQTPKSSSTPKHAAAAHSPRKSSLAGTPAKPSSVKQSRQPSQQQILTQKSSKLPSRAASILLAGAETTAEEQPSWIEKTYSQHSLTDNRPARWMEDEESAKAAITMSDDLADLGIVDCNSSSVSVDAAAVIGDRAKPVVPPKEGSRPSSGWSEFDDAAPEGEDSAMALNESTASVLDADGVIGAGPVESEKVVKIPNALFDDTVDDGAAVEPMKDASQVNDQEENFNYEDDVAVEEGEALDEMTAEQLEAKRELETVEREAIEKSNEYYSQEEATGQMEALIDQLGELIQTGAEGEETDAGGDATKVLEEHSLDQIPESKGHAAHGSEPKEESNIHEAETDNEVLDDHVETADLHNQQDVYDAYEFQNDATDGGTKEDAHEESDLADQNDELRHDNTAQAHIEERKDTELDLEGEYESGTNEYSPDYEADEHHEEAPATKSSDAGQIDHTDDESVKVASDQPVEPLAAEDVAMDAVVGKTDIEGIISDAVTGAHSALFDENSHKEVGDKVDKEHAESDHDIGPDKVSNRGEDDARDPLSTHAEPNVGPSVEPEAYSESAEDDLQFKRSAPLPPIDSTGTRPTSSKSHTEQASLSRPISARVLGPIPTPPRDSKPPSRPVSGFHHSVHASKRASLPDLVKTDSAPSSRPLSAMRPVLSHVGSAAIVGHETLEGDGAVNPSSVFTGSPVASKRASKTQSARLSKTASIAALEHSASPVVSRSRPFSGVPSSSALIQQDQDVDAVRRSISNIVASSASKMNLESAVMDDTKKAEFSKSPSKDALKSSSSTRPVSGVVSNVEVQRSIKTPSGAVSKSASVSKLSTASKSRVASERSHRDETKSSNQGLSSKRGSVKASRAQSAALGKETRSEEHDAAKHESPEAEEDHTETENATGATSNHAVAQEDIHGQDADVIQSSQQDPLVDMTSNDAEVHDTIHSHSIEDKPSTGEAGELPSTADNETTGTAVANEAESNPTDGVYEPEETPSQLIDHLSSVSTAIAKIASIIADDPVQHQTANEADIVPSDQEAGGPEQSLGAEEAIHENKEDVPEPLSVVEHSADKSQHTTISDVAEHTVPPNHDTIQDTQESSHLEESEQLSPAIKPPSATSKKLQSNYVSNSGTPKRVSSRNTPKQQLSRPGSKSKLGKGASLSDLVPLK